jgi:hypothetical protein
LVALTLTPLVALAQMVSTSLTSFFISMVELVEVLGVLALPVQQPQ